MEDNKLVSEEKSVRRSLAIKILVLMALLFLVFPDLKGKTTQNAPPQSGFVKSGDPLLPLANSARQKPQASRKFIDRIRKQIPVVNLKIIPSRHEVEQMVSAVKSYRVPIPLRKNKFVVPSKSDIEKFFIEENQNEEK